MNGRTNLTTLLGMALFFLVFQCTIASGGTLYVDANATGLDNGTSWTDAYNYLQDALADANSNPDVNEIWVAQGTYTPDSNSGIPAGSGNREATFQLISSVTLKGGYAGYGAPDPNARDIQLYETILSGDLDGNDTPGLDPCDLLDDPTRSENSNHVITGSYTEPNAVLDGFTITGGNANLNILQHNGGGMYNISGNPTVTNCTFRVNSAGFGGGGMFNRPDSSPKVTNCTFICNSAKYEGGGMSNYSDNSLELINCTFVRNSAGFYGGGMSFSGESTTMINCIFWGNTASDGNEIAVLGSIMVTSVIDVNYCDIRGGQRDIFKMSGAVNWGSGNINADPLFVDTNGPDGISGTKDDNLRLSFSSPCIDAGDPNYIAEPNETDLDGLPRVMGGRIDMGAYEFRLAVGAIVDIHPQTLNLQSKGVITAFIELPEPYSVEDIDLDSVRCQGADAIRGTIANDTLIVKFERQDLQDIEPCQDVEFLVTGELTDGTVFEGTDVIRVIDKGGKK